MLPPYKTRGAACKVLGVNANMCRSVFESDVVGYVAQREFQLVRLVSLWSGGGSVVFFFCDAEWDEKHSPGI